ncbi:MAG: IclR family transcriptional regulator C-terminal domain-containing protein [Reyranellaceae bacterium]
MADSESRRSQTFVTAFARGLSLIEAFGPQSRRMSVAEAAQRIDLDRAVTRRLLRTLVDLGYATASGRQFELTSKVLKLGYSFLASAGLDASLKPELDALSHAIGETVSVSVLDGAEVVFVARADVPGRRMAYVVAMGMRLPAFSSSSGRVLLAGRPEAEVETLLAATPLQKHTRRTITQPRELMKLIRKARADGYAINVEELEEGLIALSVPLRNRSGVVVASLNANANAQRVAPDRLVKTILPQLLAAASRMSELLL